jgi:hypothetical protein
VERGSSATSTPGTAETWRPDFPELQAFDQSCHGCLFGNPLSNFPDEYWLNINTDVPRHEPEHRREPDRRGQFLLQEMQARLKEAKLIGVDAIEFDDVDAWQSDSGIKISRTAQFRYNASLANLAHEMGFSVGLKNDLAQADKLRPYFDFAINEQCFQYHECRPLRSWPKHGKAVFNVEYDAKPRSFCPKANSHRYDFNSIGKDRRPLFDLPVPSLP